MKSASKVLFILMFLLPLIGCRTSADDKSSLQEIGGGRVFDKEGQHLACEPRDPGAICAAVLPELDRNFKGACDLAGGHTIYCGACGFEQRCTARPAVGIAYNKNGEQISCSPLDPQAGCAAVIPTVDQAFKKSCKAIGGETLWCGACGFQQACSKGSQEQTAYNKIGQKVRCEPRNPSAICAAVIPSVDESFKTSCEAADGVMLWCGACGFDQRCSKNPH